MTDDLRRKTFTNPILPGFYPDPSICRVGEDYYLVTSTFAYFPGVPIFHSRDLVNWRQIGNVLDRPSQLDLDGAEHSGGIYAPTIRYHQGRFYMITTNVSQGGNFLVTAEDPAGPWSDPYWLEDAPGIDPSLFFDGDGKVYYTGTRPNPAGMSYNGDCEVWLQELDLKNMRLTGEVHVLWKGALRKAIWPEGPHLYKINGYYYLLIAEGGTAHEHAVTVARSKKVTGPYTGNPGNPILTHRHLGRNYPIANVGHADLVETANGEWWMVLLASRPYGGYYRNLGRETFLTPVHWENDWPLVSPGDGRLLFEYPRPNLPADDGPAEAACDHFDGPDLDYKWVFLRTPRESFWSLEERPGHLRLKLRAEMITKKENPSFVGRRQQHPDFCARTAMEFSPAGKNEEAGLVLIQSERYHIRFVLTQKEGKIVLRLVKCYDGKEEILAGAPYSGEKIYMQVEADGQDYSFYFGSGERERKPLAKKVDGRFLSTDVAGGFVGTCIGLYAGSQGKESNNRADFDWFEYRGL